MSYYSIETWTIRNVAKAFNFRLLSSDPNDLKVVIPMFQRGMRWDSRRRRSFIDSLEKGYPFGALLFAKQEGINKYSVVDGLQRGSTVCDYVFNPLGKDNFTCVDSDVLDSIRVAIFPDNNTISYNAIIQEVILRYFNEQKQFDKINMFTLVDLLIQKFPNEQEKWILGSKIQAAISPYFLSIKEKYNAICDSTVPIVVYSGPKEQLNEIFNRINTKGIPLNDYEIYSATWSQHQFVINDTEVVEKVIKKYWSLSDKGYEIDGFDATKMRTSKCLTAFEFLFGLGKLWCEKYDCLKIESEIKEDDISEVSFEIVDACLNNSKSVSSLDKRLQFVNVNKLKRRIEEAIEFVSSAISLISSFKGNKRKTKVLHSKFQIVSLIAYTFRSMYDDSNLDNKKSSWGDIDNQRRFSSLLLSHYVADIISNEWHDGGNARVYTVIKERLYDEEISKTRWEAILDNYYQNQLSNKQRERFNNPTNADSIILNCIYVSLFSAADHLSSQKFDIEHLATKERMKSILNTFEDLRLPVSCIANVCYLPESINRGKKDKTIYEATCLSIPVPEIEKKFSFTTEDDLGWISDNYAPYDKEKLTKNYQGYLDRRYQIIKTKFISLFFPK